MGATSLAGLMPALVAAAGAAGPSPEDEPAFETVVRTQRLADGLDGQRAVDRASPGFATAIELDFEVGARPADALAEVVTRAPAATVRSVGGLGQFSAVSMRGSSSQQVALFIDGVPLGEGLAGLVDLSDIPLDILQRVELYRGFVPVTLGSGGIGGALNLVTASPASSNGGTTLEVGGGSFGSYAVGTGWTGTNPSTGAWHARVGLAGGSGDFPYFSDGGTPHDRSDDGTAVRGNNGYRRAVGHVAWVGDLGDWRIRIGQLALARRQRLAGPLGQPARQAHLDTNGMRTLASARTTGLALPGDRGAVALGVGLSRRTMQDPANEIGLSADDEQTDGLDIYLGPRWRGPLWTGGFVTLATDGQFEWVNVDNRLAPPPGAAQTTGDATRRRTRLGAGLQLEQYLLDARLWLVAALRADRIDNRFAVTPGAGEYDDAGRDDSTSALSPRVAARWTVAEPVAVRASAGRYLRAPTLLELFGDQGTIVGNEGLRAERGTAVDAGLVVDAARSRAAWGLYAHAAWFATWSDDLIQWFPTGPVIQPRNVAGARHRGIESSVHVFAWSQRLRAQANYTWLESASESTAQHQSGKRLPGRPEHELFLRTSAGHPWSGWRHRWEGRLFYTLEATSGTYLDPSGRRGVPPRVLQGLGVELFARARATTRAALEVRNLFDVRTTTWRPPVGNTTSLPVPLSDYIGYPLPGRSVWLTLTLRVPAETPKEEP